LTLGSSTDTTRQASASCLFGVKCLEFGPVKASWKSEVICWASSKWISWTWNKHSISTYENWSSGWI